MSYKAIQAVGLSKQYRLGGAPAYRTFREALSSSLRRGKNVEPQETSFWALKDVSFEVERGELVGIIGRNGAGKSTLLKILSRITEPTKGHAILRGRIASLLEVGTGFHPELTGRENTFLNGSILGMGRPEIERKFDEIVAFAGVEKFIDTPVKHYSSGMYLRLAFAVAAHLEPEILVVDEVLAVGDAAFQRKCMAKMEEVGQHGRTVLFVSHNMPAITRLCKRTILLGSGGVLHDGPSAQVVSSYLRDGLGTSARRSWEDVERAPGNDIVRLAAVCVRNQAGQLSEAVDVREAVVLELEYIVRVGGHVLSPNFHLTNEEGLAVFPLIDADMLYRNKPKAPGLYRSTATIPANLLAEGTFIVGAAVSTMQSSTLHVYERDAVAFQVIDYGDGDTARGDYHGPLDGVIRPLVPWRTEVLSRDTSA